MIDSTLNNHFNLRASLVCGDPCVYCARKLELLVHEWCMALDVGSIRAVFVRTVKQILQYLCAL